MGLSGFTTSTIFSNTPNSWGGSTTTTTTTISDSQNGGNLGTHKDDASGGDGAAVDTSAGLFNNPLSESSSGKLFKMQRIYDFKGNRMFTDNQILDRRKAARLSPHRMPKNSRTCEKWAVVTTIFSPTTTVKQLLEFKEWCVVVAGDKKSPPESKEEYERVSKDKPGHLVYLSPHDQSSLGYGTTPLLNWNHFGRKNVAFIYAIQHGAKVIYDVDDDNVLSEPKEPPLDALFELPSSQQPSSSSRHHQHEVIWAPTTHHLFNPYPYFDPQKPKKQPEFIWPRGFPLEFVNDKRTFIINDGESSSSPPIDDKMRNVTLIQSLAGHDPDVDAIYRLTRELPIDFTKRKKLLLLPSGVFAPTNAQAALFRSDALWAVLLPVTVHGRVTDIWRSYFAERLMWDLGHVMGFSSSFATQYRNPHSYLADFESESQLYLRAGALTSFLCQWKSSEGSLEGRIEDLFITMYEYGILHIKDVQLAQSFILDLLKAGYIFPPIKKSWGLREPETAQIVDGRK
mmetsp:Transcript_45585/g.73309  ORF Transcript_45585/g.73309 Transcript_45585/m.73309 type:complete len:512 (+) Transcript_45585:414-1949(+)